MITLSPVDHEQLRCPICANALAWSAPTLICSGCATEFPILNGVPVLINEANSVFRLSDFRSMPRALLDTDTRSFAGRLRRLIPGIGDNLRASGNFDRLRNLLKSEGRNRVLIVGGGVLGQGIERLLEERSIRATETDVWLGPRTQVICDAHDLPFGDETQDAVVAQAVLEHVADPARCVSEFRRVLKPGGLVYAETPFIQQVHLGPYDFTRFTLLGHRRLFRGFDEVTAGPLSGPGLALLWSYENFLLSFTSSRAGRNVAKALARLSGFWLKAFDRFLLDRPAALDAACAFYFLGRKAQRELNDREIIGLYRGAQQGVAGGRCAA